MTVGAPVRALRWGSRGSELAPGTITKDERPERGDRRITVEFTDGQVKTFAGQCIRDYVLEETTR